MNIAVLFAVSLLLSIFANHAYAEEPIVMERVTDNGRVKVQLIWPEVLPDQLYNIELRFLNPESNEPIADFWIIYNVAVTQNDQEIEVYTNQRTEDGKTSFEVVFPEDGTGLAQVIVVITIMGFGTTWTEMNERVEFNVHVVPEFPVLLTIVMALPFLAVVLLARKVKSNNSPSIKFFHTQDVSALDHQNG